MKNQNENYYETQSLSLAATLISLGFTLDSVDKTSNGKSTFIFPRTSNLDEAIESFWKRELRVEANAFWEAQRFLKSRIYGGGNG